MNSLKFTKAIPQVENKNVHSKININLKNQINSSKIQFIEDFQRNGLDFAKLYIFLFIPKNLREKKSV